MEIDETIISKRKHNRGSIENSKRLFGCFKKGENNICPRIIINRSRNVLKDVIKECIIEDDTVNSDLRRVHMVIFASTSDYNPYSLNHGSNFIVPITLAHAQSIESLSTILKHSLRSKFLSVYFYYYYLGEFTFRINTKSAPDFIKFNYFMKMMINLYK